jgi:hypothetical protein
MAQRGFAVLIEEVYPACCRGLIFAEVHILRLR